MNNEVLPSKNALAVIMISGAVEIDSRLLTDRQWTESLLERDLNFMEEQCSYYGGQIIQIAHTGLIARFTDTVAAVKCALDIQKTLTEAVASMQPRDVLGHSIGIHAGDAIATGTEISGIGVNIANQLQLDANWGTIHISEIIYKQVKADSTLDLMPNYLGERYHQKIYQILPQGFISSIPAINPVNFIDIDSIEIIDESSNDYIEPSRMLFDGVVNALESSKDIIKIKQLLLYACLNKWESDRLKLEKLNLKGLVQELLELTETLNNLKSLIAEITQTIEKDFTQISRIIINEISKLYSKSEPQDIYEEVIQSLEDESKDTIRIKRLLFYLYKNDFPNLDSNQLSLKIAVRELQNLYPSLESLRTRMKQALTIIAKPEYAAIMDVAIDELSVIYPVRSSSPPTLIDNLNYIETQIAVPNQDNLMPIMETSLSSDSAKSNKSFKSIDEEIAKLDLFDLRLEIIKYLSPLRVKILIFSALNNVAESTNESISAIRTFELDDLLRDLFYAFKSPEKLEAQLKSTAKQFKDINEYEQAASAIMSAVMSIYHKLGIGS